MPELKPCPFCGGAASGPDELNYDYSRFWRITCVSCPAEIEDGSASDAVAAWNRREGAPVAVEP